MTTQSRWNDKQVLIFLLYVRQEQCSCRFFTPILYNDNVRRQSVCRLTWYLHRTLLQLFYFLIMLESAENAIIIKLYTAAFKHLLSRKANHRQHVTG